MGPTMDHQSPCTRGRVTGYTGVQERTAEWSRALTGTVCPSVVVQRRVFRWITVCVLFYGAAILPGPKGCRLLSGDDAMDGRTSVYKGIIYESERYNNINGNKKGISHTYKNVRDLCDIKGIGVVGMKSRRSIIIRFNKQTKHTSTWTTTMIKYITDGGKLNLESSRDVLKDMPCNK